MVCLYVGDPQLSPRTTAPPTPRPAARWWRLDGSWLLSRERDYPNDAFTYEEMILWFAACLMILVTAAAVAGTVQILAKLSGSTISVRSLFWTLTFILGILGPGVVSEAFDRCLFTWPVALYAAFHVTVQSYCRAEQHPCRRSRWLARFAVLLLVLVSYGYFELCKLVGMFVAWCFLISYLSSFPLTYLAARAALKKQRFWRSVSWTLLAFTTFFWSCYGYLWWKSG
jgi:hypothetical protein